MYLETNQEHNGSLNKNLHRHQDNLHIHSNQRKAPHLPNRYLLQLYSNSTSWEDLVEIVNFSLQFMALQHYHLFHLLHQDFFI